MTNNLNVRMHLITALQVNRPIELEHRFRGTLASLDSIHSKWHKKNPVFVLPLTIALVSNVSDDDSADS